MSEMLNDWNIFVLKKSVLNTTNQNWPTQNWTPNVYLSVLYENVSNPS